MMTSTGIIFDIKRFAIHDGPGIRTTLFFKGCPLHCHWCHNPEGISAQPQLVFRRQRCIGCETCVAACPQTALSLAGQGIVVAEAQCRRCALCAQLCPAEAREFAGWTASAEQLLAIVEKDVIFYDESGGGVTFSGGEPLMQVDFLLALLDGCKRRAIHRTVDTSGFTDNGALRAVAAKTDLFLYDLKLMDAELHHRYTGQSNQVILDNLECLTRRGVPIIIRLPLIVGINDGPDNIHRTGEFVAGLPGRPPVELLAYHTGARHKYRKFGMPRHGEGFCPPDEDQMRAIKVRLESYGLNVIAGGKAHETTH